MLLNPTLTTFFSISLNLQKHEHVAVEGETGGAGRGAGAAAHQGVLPELGAAGRQERRHGVRQGQDGAAGGAAHGHDQIKVGPD